MRFRMKAKDGKAGVVIEGKSSDMVSEREGETGERVE